jgi:hypothetical protein
MKYFRLRLYQKTLTAGPDENVRFGRVIGYMWRRPTEEGNVLLRTFISDADIEPEILQRLVDALPEKTNDFKDGLTWASKE